jgi:hypothetical protein
MKESFKATGRTAKGVKITQCSVDRRSIEMTYEDKGMFNACVDVRNQNLTHLKLDEGITALLCIGNQLKRLKLPESLKGLVCDKELFDYDKCKVERVKIYYEHI